MPPRKRPLAEAFQESLESERAHERPRSRSPTPDYMSDALLVDVPRERSDAHTRQLAHAKRQHAERDAAAAQRAGVSVGEVEERSRGLDTDLFTAFEQAQRTDTIGSGSAAALRMMQAMGHRADSAPDAQGAGAGVPAAPNRSPRDTSPAAPSAPLRPDERWMRNRGTPRFGIGHAELSRRIASAAAEPTTDLADYRSRSSAAARARHIHGVLRKARNICRNLDEEAGTEVSVC